MKSDKIIMPKILYFLIICLILTTTGPWLYLRYLSNQISPPPIHVFIECATGPTLVQTVALIHLPENIQKIVAFNTLRGFEKASLAQKFNVIPIKFSDVPYKDILPMMTARTIDLMKQKLADNPRIRFVIHTNLFHHERLLTPLLQQIPAKNIERIHLYEDGFGNTIASRKIPLLASLALNKKPTIPDLSTPYYMHSRYPTTYHIAYKDLINTDKDFRKLKKILYNADVRDVDFYKIKETLSTRDKQNLAEIFDLDISWHQNVLKPQNNKKTLILIGPRPLDETQEKNLLKLYAKLLSDRQYNYIFKPHPSQFSDPLTQNLKEIKPDLKVIDRSIPLELLFFLDIMPDYIAGYSSSIFLTLPREKFLYYIERPFDTYLPFLIKHHIILPAQIIRPGIRS